MVCIGLPSCGNGTYLQCQVIPLGFANHPGADEDNAMIGGCVPLSEYQALLRKVVSLVVPSALAMECALLGSRSDVIPFGIYESTGARGNERTSAPIA